MWRVCPSVGGCVPCMCVCEVWVSLSHVLMADTPSSASVCSSDCRALQPHGESPNILKLVAID